MWTIAASLFAVVALGSVATIAWYGLPSWVPFAKPMFAEERPGLKLNFPENQQGMRELQDRSWFFEANGAVSNVSQTSQNVPAILVVLRDARGKVACRLRLAVDDEAALGAEGIQHETHVGAEALAVRRAIDPELPGLGTPAAGVEHRQRGFVGKQF